jgi:hypothetical protein
MKRLFIQHLSEFVPRQKPRVGGLLPSRQGCHRWRTREKTCRIRTWRRDGRSDMSIGIGRVRVKTELHAQIRFHILPPVNIVGWHGIGKGEVDFHGSTSSKSMGRKRGRWRYERQRGGAWLRGGVNAWGGGTRLGGASAHAKRGGACLGGGCLYKRGHALDP